MQNIKDFSTTVVVGAFFVIGSILILNLLRQKRLFSRKEFNPKETPTLLAIFLLAVCYFSGMFLEITSDYAIKDSSYILPMPFFPLEDNLKVEVLFHNNSCYDPTPLGWEVFKANLFSKCGEKGYGEKLEKLEDEIKSEPKNENRRDIIGRYVVNQNLQQILKETTFNIYYEGKNAVYREENYFKELMHIQQRIDFIRAIGMGSGILAFLLIIGNILLIICLLINLHSPKLLSGLFKWLNPSYGLNNQNEKKENKVLVKKISKRSVIILIILIGIYFITFPIFTFEEGQFNKRIFGYFIKLDSLQKNEHMQIINVNNN
jgi:hypothetical protein